MIFPGHSNPLSGLGQFKVPVIRLYRRFGPVHFPGFHCRAATLSFAVVRVGGYACMLRFMGSDSSRYRDIVGISRCRHKSNIPPFHSRYNWHSLDPLSDPHNIRTVR
jgi:hypothetical protein